MAGLKRVESAGSPASEVSAAMVTEMLSWKRYPFTSCSDSGTGRMRSQ